MATTNQSGAQQVRPSIGVNVNLPVRNIIKNISASNEQAKKYSFPNLVTKKVLPYLEEGVSQIGNTVGTLPSYILGGKTGLPAEKKTNQPIAFLPGGSRYQAVQERKALGTEPAVKLGIPSLQAAIGGKGYKPWEVTATGLAEQIPYMVADVQALKALGLVKEEAIAKGLIDTQNRLTKAGMRALREQRGSIGGEVPKEPWQMTAKELDNAIEVARKSEGKSDLAVFGGDQAKLDAYNRAQRMANSSNPDTADRGIKMVNAIEDKLTPQQVDALGGVGTTGRTTEELKAYRQAIGELDWQSPESLGSSLRWALTQVGTETDPLKMTLTERLAFTKIQHAFNEAQKLGWDTGRVSEAAIRASASRFVSPEEARYMLSRFMGRTSPTQEATPLLSLPNQVPVEVPKPTSGGAAGAGGIPPVPPANAPVKPVDALKQLEQSLQDTYNIQKGLRSTEKGQRVAVAEGLINPANPQAMKASTGALAGKYQIESMGLKNPLTDPQWDDIRLQIINSKSQGVKYFDRLNASEYLDRLQLHLTDPVNNPVPPPSLESAFKKVFPDTTIPESIKGAREIGPFQSITQLSGPLVGDKGTQAALKNLSPSQRDQFFKLAGVTGRTVMDIGDLLRTIQASGDVSFTMRQGLIASILHPIAGARNLGRGVRAMFSQSYADVMEQIIKVDPDSMRFIRDGGYMAPLDPASVTRAMREEGMVSNLAAKLPFVRGSNRAFVTAANGLRLDVAKQGYRLLEKAGGNTTDYRELADLINLMTGRGKITGEKAQRVATILNDTLFSPRLMMARLQLPTKLGSSSPFVRKEAAKSLAGLIGFTASILGVSALMGGKVELDPRSAAFGKLRVGDTYYDITGGNVQYVRTIARLLPFMNPEGSIQGSIKRPGGEVATKAQWDTTIEFLQSKASPLFSLIADMMAGQTYSGKPLELNAKTLITQIPNRLVPLSIQPVLTGLIEDGWFGGEGWQAGLEGLNQTPAELVGVGTVSYPEPPPAVSVAGNPQAERLVKQVLADHKLNIGRAGDTINKIKLTADETLEYQRLAGQKVGQELSKRIGQADYQAMSSDDQTAELKRVSDRAKESARVELLTSGITDPHKGDTPQIAQQRRDLQRVGSYFQATQGIVNDTVRTTIKNALRFADPGLDVALILNGESVKPMTLAAETLLKERKTGMIKDLPMTFKPEMVTYLRKIIEPYYDIPRYVWSQYPADLKTLSDKEEDYRKSAEPWRVTEANRIIRMNPLDLRCQEKNLDLP